MRAGRRPSRIGACGLAGVFAVLGGLHACGSPSQSRARLTVATSWGPLAASALHQELLSIARDLKTVDIEFQVSSVAALQDLLARQLATQGGATIDLAIVPNDWLGRFAQRGVLAELPANRVSFMQGELVGQALLAVTDRDRVLGYPVSAEVLAFVYNPRLLAARPRSLEDVLKEGSLPPGVIPFACDLSSPYHVLPLLSSGDGPRVDETGAPIVRRAELDALFALLSPVWQRPGAWRAYRGDDLESLQIQLFAEGRLASFLAGPWLLEALELTGQAFVVVPIPPPTPGADPPGALVGYQCAAIVQHSPWLDLALEVGARLVGAEVNDRLTRTTRRLPVRADAYRSRESVRAPGTLGFLSALEQGRFLPAGWSGQQRLQQLSNALNHLALRPRPPSAGEVDEILAAEVLP